MTMTNVELAILGLVVECPRHGYEIEQVIAGRGMRNWTEIGFSSIYHVLNKLERAGLVEAHDERARGRGPARKVYAAADIGRQFLREQLIKALDQPSVSQQEFLLWLSNLPVYTPDEQRMALACYRQQLLNRQQALQFQAAGPLPDHVRAMFTYSLTLVTAELSWLDEWMLSMEVEK